MVKRNDSEINMLLSALLLLSALIGGLHHWSLGAEQESDATKAASTESAPQAAEPKKDASAQTKTSQTLSENPLADADADEIISDIQPLLLSQSVEKTIKMLTGIPYKTIIQVLTRILDNKEQNFNRDDRVQVIVGLASSYKKPEEQTAILDLILDPKYLYLREGAPLLFVAAYGDFPQMIPVIKTWYANRVAKQANHAELREELETRALSYAVENQKLDELKNMVTHGITMDKKRASALLVDAVGKKTSCPIIGFLLQQGADVNYVHGGYTPLLHAIKNHDLKAVKFLVEHGADVNKVSDNKIGNPRQVAEEAVEATAKMLKKEVAKKKVDEAKHAVDIEAYLIERGAQN